MYSVFRISAALFAACLVQQAAARPLTICAEPDNLPFSHADGRGFEIEVARLLAGDLGRPLAVEYVSQRTKDFMRTTINAGRCDALMSVPAGPGPLRTTQPWYRSGYAFVTRDANPAINRIADDDLTGFTIGVAGSNTPPATLLARGASARNVRLYSIFEPGVVVDDVAHSKLDVGILWGPLAAWHAAAQASPLSIRMTPKQDGGIPLRFAIAIGVRKQDAELKGQLDAAIERNRTAIAEILARWHVPTVEDE